MIDGDLRPVDRIKKLDDPLGGAWEDSFADMRGPDGQAASGYNATSIDTEGATMPYHVGTSSECPAGKPHAVIKNSDGKVMGCHESEQKAHAQIAAINASEGDHTVTTEVQIDLAMPMVSGGMPAPGYGENFALMSGTPWEGVLVVEGVTTGDGREFAHNAVTWAEPPLPLRRNIEESHGGAPTTTTVLVGRTDEVWRNPDNPAEILGRGVFDDNGANGAEALRLVREGFLKGISVDPDNISDADVELIFPESQGDAEEDPLAALFAAPEKTIFHAGRLRAATLCDIPAFVEAQIWLTDQTPAQEAVAAAASGHFGELSDRTWNGAVHEQRLAPHLNVRLARQAYAHVGRPGAKTATRFLHHEVTEVVLANGTDAAEVGAANLTACSVALRAINGGRAMALDEDERRAAYAHLAEHLRAAGLVPPPYEDPGQTLTAGLFDHLVRPPRAWFENPRFEYLTPLTVTDEGRVFGHAADWAGCHTAFPGVCTSPPVEGEHAYFRLGEIVCDDNSRVAVGHITLGTGHAPTRGITSSQAAEHYDNTGTVVAIVASGEDEHGIWVAGAIKPGTSESRVQELRMAPLSGDWRRIGGKLRLVAFLAVVRPGFPVPRLKTHVRSGEQYSLVAAGVVSQDMRHINVDPGVNAALQRIARGIGRDPATRLQELRKRVKGE